jgi:hypothetical protein
VNDTLSQESTQGSGGTAPFTLNLYMEVSGQLHAPAALPPEQSPPVIIKYKPHRALESVRVPRSKYDPSVMQLVA